MLCGINIFLENVYFCVDNNHNKKMILRNIITTIILGVGKCISTPELPVFMKLESLVNTPSPGETLYNRFCWNSISKPTVIGEILALINGGLSSR